MPDTFTFDPLDPDSRRDPFHAYAQGRREAPVHFHEGLPLRHPLYDVKEHDVAQVLQRRQVRQGAPDHACADEADLWS